MWDAIIDAVIGSGGGADTGGGIAGLLGGVDWGTVAGTGLGLAGTGLQAYQMYNSLNPPEMPQMQMPSGWGTGMMGQMGQGATQEQIRGRLTGSQERGMSGASPDFLAAMAGYSPQEFEKMMGYGQR